MRIFPKLFALSLLSLAALQGAIFIGFADRAGFNAAVPGLVLKDFEVASGFPAAPAPLDFIDATIDLSTPGGDSTVSVYNYGFGFGQAIGGRSGGVVNNFLPVLISFSAPYFAVGFDDLDLTGANTEFAIVTVNFASGPPGVFILAETDADYSTAAFFGILSDTAITSVEVYSADNIGDPPGARANLIDNLAISRHAITGDVPEPSTWMAAAGGLVLLMARRFRRR